MTAPVTSSQLARQVAYHRRRQAIVSDPAMVAYHQGRADGADAELAARSCCRRCGRPIHDPESLERGYGGDCWAQRQAL